MNKLITVNGQTYKAVDLTFNSVCELEDLGVDLTSANTKGMSLIRAYLALCMKCDIETAGAEMQNHVINGGDFAEVASIIAKAIEESGFFQATRKTQKEKAKIETITEFEKANNKSSDSKELKAQ